MKILYISDHAVLEYDELQLFTDLGHECFSLGAYHNLGHADLPRPAIQGLKYYEDLDKVYTANPNRNEISDVLIEWADVIIFMHAPSVLMQNWERIKHKRVVWRTIGQSVANIEAMLAPVRSEITIVRYSPKEASIAGYIGADAMIRFYKDPEVFNRWEPKTSEVITFAQSLKGRREFCHYNEIFPVIEAFDGKIYGPGNEDVGQYNGGSVSFEQQLEIMRRAAVMIYAGTWPASYTLSFMEALMIGIPIVAVSKQIAHLQGYEDFNFYEVDEMLAKISAPVCDTVDQMIVEVDQLINNPEHAAEMSRRQRELAVELFGKRGVGEQWKRLLDSF